MAIKDGSLRIYLAAPYISRMELCRYVEELTRLGHTVTSRWLRGENQVHGPEAAKIVEDIATLQLHPLTDALFAIGDSDVFICFASAGGRGDVHVEYGYALAVCSEILLVGPVQHIFHCVRGVIRLKDWSDVLLYLSPIGDEA